MAEILVLNGPNLNLLGTREPRYYGSSSLETINTELARIAAEAGYKLSVFQSNAEHELVQRVHQSMEQKAAFILLNPAAFTHTSIALRDALAATAIPFIEVHLSNIHARESFRRHSYFSDLAKGVISGLGAQGYELALAAAIRYLKNQDNNRGHTQDQEAH